jgi:hypothetical protein
MTNHLVTPIVGLTLLAAVTTACASTDSVAGVTTVGTGATKGTATTGTATTGTGTTGTTTTGTAGTGEGSALAKESNAGLGKGQLMGTGVGAAAGAVYDVRKRDSR